MKNLVIQLLSICALLALANCSSRHAEDLPVEITVEVGEGFLEKMKEFQQKMQKVIDPIEREEDFSNVSVQVNSESSSTKDETISTFVLLLNYDKALETDEETLFSIGKQTLQGAISNLQDPSHGTYKIKFLKDSSTDPDEAEVLKVYEFAPDELIES